MAGMASVAEAVEVDGVGAADKAEVDKAVEVDRVVADRDAGVEVDKVDKVGVAHNEDKTW